MSVTIGRPDRTVPSRLPEVGSDVSRKRFLIAAGFLVFAPACGEGSRDGARVSGGTRTVEHKYGATEISGTPERVVSVGYTDQDPVLALGLQPVGVREWFGGYENATWPWARDELGDASPETVAGFESINFEAVAATSPDLIVGVSSGMTRDDYDTLSEIAPTVAQSGEYVDYGAPWQVQTRTIGRALGREERAEELVSEIESRFARARRRHPEFRGATGVVALTRGTDGNPHAYGPQDARGRFLVSLGFETPQEIVDLADGGFYATFSRERLGLLDTDLLVWIVNPSGERGAIEDDPLYRALDVYTEGRDIFLENNVLDGALSFSTVLSLPLVLDELVPRMAAAVDGESGTTR